MLLLPNNCRAGNISVYPSNWKTTKASVKFPWHISYRFYDDNLSQQKRIVIKGMNHLATAAERRTIVEAMIAAEIELIKNQAYNHITQQYFVEQEEAEISPYTKFEDALTYSFKNIKIEADTKSDIKSVLKYFSKALDRLKYNRLPIKEITKRHIKLALIECGKIKVQTRIPIGKTGKTKPGIWTANQYNHYRKYISILINELLELDVIEYNPVHFIKKQTRVKVIRETLTHEQRKTVNGFLRGYHYPFWRFLQIFFHSGSRIIEMLNVKRKDVDLDGQRFKVTVKKGKLQKESWRVIKTIALPLWKEVCDATGEDQYLFSAGLKPGDKAIRREQITKRWRVHVKEKLHITADFYSLKHTNLDEVSELLNIQEAQKMAGHSTPVITMTYATGEKQRQQNKLRDIANNF